MNVLEFFKPTLGKILVFILFMVLISILMYPTTHMLGGPISEHSFITIGLTVIDHICGLAYPSCVPGTEYRMNYWSLVINVIVWYLVACAIVTFYKRNK